MFYFVKSPVWFQWVYPNLLWKIRTTGKVLYLTFDDGPHPEATPFVLHELKKHKAKATFFCVGKNVVEYPDLYNKILSEGHITGNHTYNHPNGRKVGNKEYLENIKLAANHIDSKLFRPPYGSIRNSQSAFLEKQAFKVVMWTVLSGDFDPSVSGKKCANNVIRNTGPGSIVVFHDSQKAFNSLKNSLPEVLDYFSSKGYEFHSINQQ